MIHTNQIAAANAHATAAAIAYATANPYGGRLALYDPLQDNSHGNKWDEISNSAWACMFSDGAYHVLAIDTHIWYYCNGQVDFSNFAFEI